METFTDNDLMLKVKKGDIDKMGILYDRYSEQLFRFLFNMTRQREISEDMVQNVFFRMLRYPDGFAGFGEFRTWMYHIARNVVYDHFRKVKRTPFTEQVDALADHPDTGQASDSGLEKEQDLRMLEKAMARLSDENRELLIMCRYQELKYTEIARILNTTEGAVKVRVHRALHQLKENFLSNSEK